MNRNLLTILLALTLLLIACSAQGELANPTAVPTAPAPTVSSPTTAPALPTPEPPTPQPTEEPTPTEEAVPTEEPTVTPLSFEPAVYRNEVFGFEFDYPASWTISDLGTIGDRGSAVQFQAPGSAVDDVALQATMYLWDPTGDLDAYANHRQTAWTASDTTIISQEDTTLNGDHPAASFVVRTQVGEEAFFFFTAIGDRYLELSGSHELDLLAEIAGTMRLLELEPSSSAAADLGCLTATYDSPQWVACNVMDGILSRNLSALHGFMADPFTIGYWGSEGRTATPQEVTAELRDSRLPADPAAVPLTFTIDRSQFPPLQGIPVDGLLGPQVNVVQVIYSEGWGTDGQGAALIYITQNEARGTYWHGLIFSGQHFDK